MPVTAIYTNGGLPLLGVDGKVAADPACCCGDQTCPEFPYGLSAIDLSLSYGGAPIPYNPCEGGDALFINSPGSGSISLHAVSGDPDFLFVEGFCDTYDGSGGCTEESSCYANVSLFCDVGYLDPPRSYANPYVVGLFFRIRLCYSLDCDPDPITYGVTYTTYDPIFNTNDTSNPLVGSPVIGSHGGSTQMHPVLWDATGVVEGDFPAIPDVTWTLGVS